MLLGSISASVAVPKAKGLKEEANAEEVDALGLPRDRTALDDAAVRQILRCKINH